MSYIQSRKTPVTPQDVRDKFDYKSASHKLKELYDKGIINRKRKGRKYVYTNINWIDKGLIKDSEHLDLGSKKKKKNINNPCPKCGSEMLSYLKPVNENATKKNLSCPKCGFEDTVWLDYGIPPDSGGMGLF